MRKVVNQSVWSVDGAAKSLALIALLALVAAALPAPGHAKALIYQRVPFASTPNPVGSGGRAVGWGGAFIAIADDATAASWNPGGLVQLLKPESSVVFSYHTRMESLEFQGYNAGSESGLATGLNVNYASAVYPFHVGSVNLVASLNYQRLYEFDRDLKYDVAGVEPGGDIFSVTRRFEQAGALTTVTPAFAVQITPAWSMGLSVNFWGLDTTGDGWDQQWQVDGVNRDPLVPGSTVHAVSESRESYTVHGTNFVVGTQFKIQNWTLAAVYKTAFEADVDFRARMEVSNYFPFNPIANSHAVLEVNKREKLVWPESYGVGVAYRYSDRLSFALDAYTTLWSHYKLKTPQGDLNLLAGNDKTADIQDTWQVRMGAEYIWILPKYAFELRGGAFYDPEPLQDRVNNFYGVTVGGGMVFQNYVIDAALQYRWANDIQSEKVEGVEASTDVQEFFAIVSLIYLF